MKTESDELKVSDGLKWAVVVVYRSDKLGKIDVHHTLKELFELHDIIEKGPHFDTILEIKIHRYHPFVPELSLEKAKQL